MKRLILTILGVILAISFAYSDSPETTITQKDITKSNGGIGALFNLYDYVNKERTPGAAEDGGLF